MLAKRIIPCLDVKDGFVVKGLQFNEHRVVGNILELARRYLHEGADELVFYDITASCDARSVDITWISNLAEFLDIPFCVAGGIRDLDTAYNILHSGADKISINSPALENPNLIRELADTFGSQCIVVGVDSYQEGEEYFVYQYTGDKAKAKVTKYQTLEWAKQVESLGAGEIVLNCMNQDGARQGYDIEQIDRLKNSVSIPVIASGGAGCKEHFEQLFNRTQVDGALAASVFHNQQININSLKKYLKLKNIQVRL